MKSENRALNSTLNCALGTPCRRPTSCSDLAQCWAWLPLFPRKAGLRNNTKPKSAQVPDKMKFSKQLLKQSVPEWRGKYIDYLTLKLVIKHLVALNNVDRVCESFSDNEEDADKAPQVSSESEKPELYRVPDDPEADGWWLFQTHLSHYKLFGLLLHAQVNKAAAFLDLQEEYAKNRLVAIRTQHYLYLKSHDKAWTSHVPLIVSPKTYAGAQ